MKLLVTTMLGLGVLTAGCYQLEPAAGMRPESGAQVALDITDAGREALSGSMGPQIEQVTGLLVAADSSQYVIAVKEVRYLRGDIQVWRGESVRISTPYVSRVYLRKFSRGRTLLLTAVAIGAGAALAKGGVGFFPDRPAPDTNETIPVTLKGSRRPLAQPPSLLRLIPLRSH